MFFNCPICLEKRWFWKSISLACKHEACVNCFALHIQKTKPVRCIQCSTLVDRKWFLKHNVLTREVDKGWFRWECSTNPNLAECARCKTFNSKPVRGYRVQCQQCKETYCFNHGKAHGPQMSCREFNHLEVKRDSVSIQTIKRISKPCPSCHVMTEKTYGCDHMTCNRCHAKWCWNCKRVVQGSYYEHKCPFPIENINLHLDSCKPVLGIMILLLIFLCFWLKLSF